MSPYSSYVACVIRRHRISVNVEARNQFLLIAHMHTYIYTYVFIYLDMEFQLLWLERPKVGSTAQSKVCDVFMFFHLVGFIVIDMRFDRHTNYVHTYEHKYVSLCLYSSVSCKMLNYPLWLVP